MAGDAQNRVNPVPGRPDAGKVGGYRGDLPEPIAARYYSETKLGAPLAFYRDATTTQAAFRDHGGRLSTARNDPHVVRDLVLIAQHRGWTAVAVRGEPAFRREVWLRAQLAGLEVRGYRPTARDRQELDRRTARQQWDAERHEPAPNPAGRQAAPEDPGARARLQVVEAVVRSRVADPAAQTRIVEAARGRMADWVARGARFAPWPERRSPREPRPERQRAR